MHDQNEAADIAIINTCGFIFDAKQESVDTILQFAREKKNGRLKKLFVMGCLSERYKNDLVKEIPEVDAFYGVNDLEQIILELGNQYYPLLHANRDLTTGHYAFLKIAEGCNRQCSFCAIPLIRGKHISRPPEEIIREAEKLVDEGTKEIILISQDLTYYGMEQGGSSRLPELVEALSGIPGLDWLRLHYAYPAKFPMALPDIMNSRDNICNYLDIPFQHISDPVLKSMRRGIDQKQTYQLIDTIRQKVPGIALRTSLMVGYPAETNEDFEELKAFVKSVKFERLGVFTYSHEEDTHAYRLNDSIPEEIKQSRMQEIMDLQESISLSLNQSKIGQTIKVLIDRREGDFLVGRSEFDSPEVDNEVLITHADDVMPGTFRQVKISGASAYDLSGIIVK